MEEHWKQAGRMLEIRCKDAGIGGMLEWSGIVLKMARMGWDDAEMVWNYTGMVRRDGGIGRMLKWSGRDAGMVWKDAGRLQTTPHCPARVGMESEGSAM